MTISIGAPVWTSLAAEVASCSRVVALPGSGRLSELLDGCATNLVFSNAEQRLCHRRTDLTGWGGRLAAKLAVCDLLGVDGGADVGVDVDAAGALRSGRDVGLAGIEILPEPHGLCGGSGSCFKPHAPQVVLAPQWAALVAPATRIQISISHTRRLAIALAARSGGSLAEGR